MVAQDLGQYLSGFRDFIAGDRYMVKTADGAFSIDLVGCPCSPLIFSFRDRKFKL